MNNLGGGGIYSAKKSISYDLKEYSEILFSQSIEEKVINAFFIMDGINERESSAFILNDIESLVVNSKIEFELALILKKKENSALNLEKMIHERIKDKMQIFRNGYKKGICLIGHSQIDNWNIKRIGGKEVRNCGVSGISSFEYNKYILQENLLACCENEYILMHGTNDIIYDYTCNYICESINKTIEYIRGRNPLCTIYFVGCIHVNGRLDRSNSKIDELNSTMKCQLKYDKWIDTSSMNDEYGNLKHDYTSDGLHLSDNGYEVLRNIIEKNVR